MLGDDIFGEGNIAELFLEFEDKHICHTNEFCLAFGIVGEFEDFNAPKDNSVMPGVSNVRNIEVGSLADAEGSDE